jgi:hypothetical protein
MKIKKNLPEHKRFVSGQCVIEVLREDLCPYIEDRCSISIVSYLGAGDMGLDSRTSAAATMANFWIFKMIRQKKPTT